MTNDPTSLVNISAVSLIRIRWTVFITLYDLGSNLPSGIYFPYHGKRAVASHMGSDANSKTVVALGSSCGLTEPCGIRLPVRQDDRYSGTVSSSQTLVQLPGKFMSLYQVVAWFPTLLTRPGSVDMSLLRMGVTGTCHVPQIPDPAATSSRNNLMDFSAGID